MAIRIGAGPIGWFEDDFSAFRNDIVREAHLTALTRAGFDGVCLNPGSAREVACVHATLARHRLAFIAPTHKVALTRETAETAFAVLQPHIRAARALGATEVSVSDTASIDSSDADWERFASRLDALAASFKAAGVRLVYRPVAGTIVADAAAIDRLMAETGEAVGLMLDADVLGPQTLDIADRHAARIAMVAPGANSDAIIAALPHFAGWTVLDERVGHAEARVEHAHEVAEAA
jgi:inosose dehydratase